MTCIAGMIQDDAISMGGDFLCTSLENGSRYVGSEKNVCTKNWAIGMAGSSRSEYYLRQFRAAHMKFQFKDISAVDLLTEWINENVGPDLVLGQDETDFANYPFELMVASKFGLWVIETDLSIYEIRDFSLIGTGSEVGIGVLDMLYTTERPPQEVYSRLMPIVSKYNTTVGSDCWVKIFPR
jgi:hypothetical protein